MMTMRKRLRRRCAVRELLQKLVTAPFCEDAPPVSGGMLGRPRPGLWPMVHAPGTRAARGHLHD
jgi:hypothetical protein